MSFPPDDLQSARSAPPVVVLEKYIGPGRCRDVATELWRQVAAEPLRASALLRHGMRQARQLHSKERRFVGDVLFDLIRYHRPLSEALGSSDPMALWLGWLVVLGVAPEKVAEGYEGPGEPDFAAARSWGEGPSEAVEAVAWRASVAPRLARALVDTFGGDARAFVEGSNRRAPVTVRARRSKGGRKALARELGSRGIEAEPTALAPDGLTMTGRANLAGLPAALRARFELQDEASQVVAGLAADLKPSRVLDFCAGAGGKSLALADRVQGKVVATDVRSRALEQLRKRAQAGGDKHIQTQPLTPEGVLSAKMKPFDVVLVDAPCSGSGVWRRHPELRFRGAQLDETLELQATVLDNAAPWVRPGGHLVFATCSVLKAEDEAQVQAFLDRHPDFEVVPVADVSAVDLGDLVDGPYLRTLPHVHDMDGFFAAVLRRRG